MNQRTTRRHGPVYSDDACRDIWTTTQDSQVKVICSNALRGDLKARQQIVDMLKTGKFGGKP
jgi:hypothetical protein